MDKIKKDLLKILDQANDIFIKDYPNTTYLTRDYFKNYLKQNTEYSYYSDYMSIWGNFKNLLEEIKIDRQNFNIKKDDSNKPYIRKYFITSILQGCEIDEDFMTSIFTYCKKNKAEFILLTMKNIIPKNYYGKEIYEKYNKYFATEYIFNKNLIAKDFIQNPQLSNHTTGLYRYGNKNFSMIVSSPKRFLQTIPSQKGGLPHIIYTTGTCCKSNYTNTKNGILADQDHLIGGLVVEILDDLHFNIRNIDADNEKGFFDLNKYYIKNKIVKSKSYSVICGDIHYGSEDEKAIKATKEIIKELKPKYIFFHDLFDANSVNPHDENDMIKKLQRQIHQKTLKDELNYLKNKLEEWQKEFKDKNFYVIPSNHDAFIDRYLTQRKFINDEMNIILSCELFVALVKGNNPIEYYLKENGFNLKNFEFLKVDESFELLDIQLNNHGDKGNNGSKGNIAGFEKAFGKCIIGHGHQAIIYRNVYMVPCLCKLDQTYNKGGSSWLHGNVIIYPNGQRQMILIIDGVWNCQNREVI